MLIRPVRHASLCFSALLTLAALAACGDGRSLASPCQIDSDCKTGFACGGDGYCAACADGALSCAGCDPGELGCACLSDGSCKPSDARATELSCDADTQRCVSEMMARPIPKHPKCYTPCSNDLALADGSLRRCAEDGLMEGCIGLTECIHGSCLVPELDAERDATDSATGKASQALTKGCTRDLDCPSFQACFADGQCYSECEVNSECPGDMRCQERVCRIECSTSQENACPKGYLCESEDSQLGFCRPSGEASEAPMHPAPIDERFTLSTTALALSNNTASATFTLTNEADAPLTFTLRKVDHTELTDKGPRKETKNPLFWLSMGEKGNLSKKRELSIPLGAHETRTIRIEGIANKELLQWEGHLEVFQPGAGAQTVLLTYSTSPDGLWAGRIYYMINFDDGGDAAIAAWRQNPASQSAAKETHNAFLVRWSDFVSTPQFSLEEWMALVDSTVTGSWNYAAVREACEEGRNKDTQVLCYPYASGDEASDGLSVYTGSDSERIPSGVVEMPFAMTLQKRAGDDNLSFEGRVQSTATLQYPGFPGATLSFAADPKSCGTSNGHCLVPVKDFEVRAYTGARYLSNNGYCGKDTHALEQPWLVESFTQGSVGEPNRLLRTECREASFPLTAQSLPQKVLNASLSGTNPVPDGVRRARTLELLDGRLINQEQLLMIVRETFDAQLSDRGPTKFSGYGLMMLRRQPADLTVDDYEPAEEPGPATALPPSNRGDGKVMCPVLADEPVVTASNAARQIKRLLEGDLATPAQLTEVKRDSVALKPQYLCHDTGRFNGGNPNWEVREPCPRDSRVTYFLYKDDLSHHACQGDAGCPGGECETEVCQPNGQCVREAKARGACAPFLQSLASLVETPVVACGTPSTATAPYTADFEKFDCHEDRGDLLKGRVFFRQPEGKKLGLDPLNLALANAFRYKLAFLSRSGKTLGFVPSVCKADSDAIPYCYAPNEIETVRDRADCLAGIFRELGDDLSVSKLEQDTKARLDLTKFLRTSFGADSDLGDDGFERLHSELLVMLGDDAFTRALGSRFDLAGSATRGFEGDLFEPNGIRLSGGAGYEMRTLYQARQSYEMVLDRFYRLSGILWDDVGRDDPELVEPATITNYVGRVVLASTKKASVTSEIARRYQGLGRADLARHVVERDYARAYLESVVLNQLLREYLGAVGSADAPELQAEMARAQNLYSAALEKMRETYQDLTDELTYFGDPPDFVPFPAPARFDLVAPQAMIERAMDTMRIAKERDDRALSSNRQFDTDSAQFNSELRRVQLSFENQLAELCGTFATEDGQLVAAIPKYAKRSPALSALRADPCGLGSTGQIHEQVGQIEVAATDLRLAIQEGKDILREVAIEQERVDSECSARLKIATLQYTGRGAVITLEGQQREHELAISDWERKLAIADRTSRMFSATGQALQQWGTAVAGSTSAPWALGFNIASGVAFTGAAVSEAVGLGFQDQANKDNRASQEAVHDKAEKISTLQSTTELQAELSQCYMCNSWDGKEGGEGKPNGKQPICPEKDRVPGPLRIQADARIKTLLIGLMRAQLNGLKADLALQIAQGRVSGLRHQATRVMAQAEEAEELLVDVEVARNDPNIRLLRNADVLDADKAFHEALVDAYRATRVFEYYTAQSYGPKNELFLARLAARGEHSVENYLLDLQRALHNFENAHGRPSKRVHVVSMRDDIMRIARTDKNGVALSEDARISAFRKALEDPSLLDERGYITVPFAIDELSVSPLTAIHKLEHIEAEVQGSGVGDRLGRIYLTPRGTATMRTLDDGRSFLRLPAVTAVVNTFFNGVKPTFVDPEVYQSLRLRERPLLNSLWELGFNQRDEQVNEDIQVSELTDIRVYLYYEDFTLLD